MATRNRGSEILEAALWLAGILCLFTVVTRVLSYALIQAAPASGPLASSTGSFPHVIVAYLRIPRLQVDLRVVEGDDDDTLALGPGHLSDSAPIGSSGNAVIAGHRDMAFRSLRFLKTGDELRVTSGKTYVYLVDTLRIVKPDDLSVMERSARPVLTLVTCYPFRFLGSAPERYVVRATLKYVLS